MKAVDHKCPSCNANIDYNPKIKKWDCDYCGSVFTLKELEANEKKFDSVNTNKSVELKEKEKAVYDEYNCNNCGAKIIADPNTAATFCVYCKNTAILKSRLSEQFSPSKLIAFNLTKQDAIDAFKKVGKGKFLMPKEFSDPRNIQELTGIYIPFWLYSCKMDSFIEGTGKKISTWRVGDYMYTKTDSYNVQRNSEFTFKNIPADGSIRFDDAIMNSIEPFDYKELVDFNPSFLSGFLAEKYDIGQEIAKQTSSSRAEQTAGNIISKVSGYNTFIKNSETHNASDEVIEYVLLPVWMVNIKYKDKFYLFAMNGQTGKMIGDIPYSKPKMFAFSIILFVVLFVIIYLLTYAFS